MIYYKLIILILILFLGYILKLGNEENFSNSIMSNKKYLKHFNKLDLKLRGCSDLDNCIKKYNSSVSKFNNQEKKILNQIVKSIKDRLGDKFKKIFKDIRFIRVENYIENSLPHTRDKYIVLSESWFKKIFDKYNISENFINYNIDLRKLIYHEQFHIFQRYNKNLMEKLYKKYWDMEKLDIVLPEKLQNINRTNPDALPTKNNHWLFKINNFKYILPLCVYNSSNENDIRNTSNIYIVVNKKNNKYFIENLDEQIENKKYLINYDKYTKFFGNESGNNYHPNELSASIFEDIVENETKINYHKANNYPAYKKMYTFLKIENLI